MNNINPIYVTQDVKNCTYFSVILEFNTVKYQASHVKHYVDMTPFDVYVKSAYHNGQDVIVMKERTIDFLDRLNDEIVKVGRE